mgnify:CR=1 FL=1
MHIKNQSTRNGLHKNSNKVLGEFSLIPEENNYTYSISEKQFSMLKGNKNILNH